MAFGDRDNRDRQPRESFKAVCSDCGKECEVPFKPSQGKPVYCRDCYKNHAPQREDRDNRGRQPRESFKAVCSDCGKECEVPFKPSQGKPVYCRDCYKNHAPQREERFRRF